MCALNFDDAQRNWLGAIRTPFQLFQKRWGDSRTLVGVEGIIKFGDALIDTNQES